MDPIVIIALIIGLGAGAAAAWLLTRSQAATRIAAAESALAAQQARTEELTAEHRERLAEQDARHRERLEELKNDHDRLTDSFKALSAEALEKNSEAFLRQAEQRLGRAQEASAAELAKREQAVKSLVDPLTKSLDDVKKQMSSAERARAEAHGAITQQVKAMASSSDALRSETSQLVSALRASHVRGRWGELQLRRVVEVAGMLNHVDFTEQYSVEVDGAVVRPDMVVHLPGQKQIVVDAKVSLSAFLEAAETTDDAERSRRLSAHSRHVQDHVKSLADKSYWEALENTPEFVVMFVPADSMLSAALETDPSLLEYAFSRNVVIATPATLVALLRTVAYTWRQERLAEDAQKIFVTGKELHKRLGTFGRHLNDLGKRLNAAVGSFNKLNRSIDSNLLPQVKRFSELQGIEEPFVLADPVEALAIAAEKPDLFTEPNQIEASVAVTDGAAGTDEVEE